MSAIAEPPVVPPSAPAAETLGAYARRWWTGVRSGDLGSLPIIVGLILIAVIFQSQNDRFLTAGNFVNLIVQMAAITVLGMGIVFVLLLGEIDLSIGFVSGVAGVTTALLMIPDGSSQVGAVPAIALALAAGAGAGLPAEPISLIALRIAGLAAAGIVVVAVANQDRGIPYVFIVITALYILWTYVLNRTRFGRHIYAVGGNAEAARRAGINVDNVRIACFAICSAMAALGGIILASRLRSIDTNSGGGDLLLNSIAAAVIGGTSLFGGRGHIKSAVLCARGPSAGDHETRRCACSRTETATDRSAGACCRRPRSAGR